MTPHRLARMTVAGLLLLATVAVSGALPQDLAAVSVPVAHTEQSVHPAAAIESAPETPQLDLTRLERTPEEGEIVDLFAAKSWYVPPPPPPPPKPMVTAPPAPVAPPLPFAYAGRLAYPGGKEIVYLTKGKAVFTASAGDLVDTNYRLESIGESEIVFVYLPLTTQQTLSAPRK